MSFGNWMSNIVFWLAFAIVALLGPAIILLGVRVERRLRPAAKDDATGPKY